MPISPNSFTITASHAVVDCLFLTLVTAVSMLTYVRGLGFYYDDYSVLYRMAFSDDQSLGGLYDSVRPATGQRPLQALTFATLYRLFGLDPLGYHLANAFLLVAVAALLYLVMRELRLFKEEFSPLENNAMGSVASAAQAFRRGASGASCASSRRRG